MNKAIFAILLISLSACKETPKEEPALSKPQQEALQDFQNAGDQAKENYKVKVSRSKIDWNSKSEDGATEENNSEEKKE